MDMKVEIDLSGIVILDGEGYMVTSCEQVAHASPQCESGHVILILSGAGGDVKLVFNSELQEGR